MRIEDGFYYKTGLVSYDFLDLFHELDIGPRCLNCVCSHDWPDFVYYPLNTYCKYDTAYSFCPLGIFVLVYSGKFH